MASTSTERKRFSREDRLKAAHLRKRGESVAAIAERLGVAESYLRPLIMADDPDRQIQMIDEAESGASFSDLADKYEVSARRAWQLVGKPSEDQRDPNYRTLRINIRHTTVDALIHQAQRMKLTYSDAEDAISSVLDHKFNKIK